MKLHLFLIFSFYLFAIGISAQAPPPPIPKATVIRGDSDKPVSPNADAAKGSSGRLAPPAPPPPPPFIYSAPDKSLVNKFSSDKFGFTADFPGKPETTESKADGANINTFKVKLKGSNETIEIYDYDFNVEQKLGAEELFAQIRQKHLNAEGAELAYEKDVEQNGLIGKEFGVELFGGYYRVRAFVKNARLYELTTSVVNWSFLGNSKQKEFNDEADRFLASFKIDVSAPAVKTENNSAEKIELFKSKSNIFEAPDGSFRIYLPGKPDLKTNKMATGFGEVELTVITLPAIRAYYGITYFDYPVVVADPSEIRFISDEQRDVFIANKFELLSEKDISFKGNYGREYVLTNGRNTVVLRNFFVKQRFFRLLAITNGVKNKIPQTIAEQNDLATYRFLDSFEGLKLPQPEFSEIKLPEDFGLKNENSTISSEHFGFSMSVPENWNVLNRQQSDLLKDYTYMSLQDENSVVRNTMEKSLSNTKILFAVLSPEKEGSKFSGNIMVGAEKMTLPRFQPESVAALYVRELLDKDEELVGQINKIKLDGVDFAWFETLRKTTGTRQRIYYSNQKNLAFMLVLTYQTDEDLKILTDKLNTIKFKK